ncbi:S-methyl-5'-thioadenosine phosphorylase [Athalia rosae]|uniref:S-methyl-5'-thioadenosine phosphorylase n=1 Tax=Athalia rosae TaxID=37344 RepID=UPI0006263530|nr:S-methyl-5'-thioadenosine phosphorylase [Athalia rosae]XP_048509902.1 S-methyl-5'-thioadenosine phosphorylase [Athalia rosae]
MGKYTIKVGIIGGSGLDDPAAQILQQLVRVSQEDAKNDFGYPSSDLYHGFIGDTEVVLLSRHGVGHKIIPSNVNYRANIEALRLAGCTHILASTACGSLQESIRPGDLVLPDSFLDRTSKRANTFFDGTSKEYQGVCHVPMEPAFHPDIRKIILKAASLTDIKLQDGGTVVTIEGPRFSSKAESRAFQQWGGDLINMTLCPEVCLAKEAGILYGAIALATDYDCWRDTGDKVCVADVMAVFKKNVARVTQLLIKAVELVGSSTDQGIWDQKIDELKNLVESSNVSSNKPA